jgi:hypothetical protein
VLVFRQRKLLVPGIFDEKNCHIKDYWSTVTRLVATLLRTIPFMEEER